MRLSEHERLVDRYLLGEMTHAEEEEFVLRMATEPELVAMVRAHRFVDNALRNDREALPDDSDEVGERARAALVAASLPQGSALHAPAVTGAATGALSSFPLSVIVSVTALVFAAAGFLTRGLIVSDSAPTTSVVRESPSRVADPTTVPGFGWPSTGNSATGLLPRSDGGGGSTLSNSEGVGSHSATIDQSGPRDGAVDAHTSSGAAASTGVVRKAMTDESSDRSIRSGGMKRGGNSMPTNPVPAQTTRQRNPSTQAPTDHTANATERGALPRAEAPPLMPERDSITFRIHTTTPHEPND